MEKEVWFKDWGDYGYTLVRLKHTGRCKIVTGGSGLTGKFYEHKRSPIFGGRVWIHENDIVFFDKKSVTYCNCTPKES